VGDDGAFRELVTGVTQPLDRDIAGPVAGELACARDPQHGDVQRNEGACLSGPIFAGLPMALRKVRNSPSLLTSPSVLRSVAAEPMAVQANFENV
jgi:hypothetical protein